MTRKDHCLHQTRSDSHGLAVHCDDSAAGDGAGTCTEPGPHMSVEVRGVQVLEHPPDGRLRREGLPLW